MILISDLPDMVVDQVEVAETITITLHATSPTAACPWCGAQAQRVQSRYIRHLADLPASGRRVRFVVQVRRFFCQKSPCVRKIFAERFPSLALPYAQRTIRLQEALRSLGLIAGGESGAQLGARLGYSGSADTILRLLRQVSIASGPSPRIVGVDDWAWKKGQRYGTIIVDQERHRVVDLLADRSVETVAAWFRAHPTVEMVSRDRSAEYARAIRQGAPHAIQVADRFHLMQNLREAVQELLGQYWKELRERPKPSENLRAEAVAPREVDEWRPHPQPRRETIRLARQAERAERYEQVVALQAQGLSIKAIADRLQYSERSIRRWLAQGTLTYTKRRRKKRSHFDAYAPYVLKRWSQGCRNGQQLWREIQAQGYHDSPRMLYQYLRTLRSETMPVLGEEPSSPLDTLTFQQAVWFFLRDPVDLDPRAQEQLAALQQASSQAAQAYRLVQAFAQMVRRRTGTQLVPWLDDVAQSQFPALAQFADGLKADQDAVMAGLILPWSQGQVEGQVNRLKVIKRSMYGRAKFDLLRPRLLHSA